MNRRVLVYLDDILQSIDNIALHLTGIGDGNAFSSNLTVRRAVERELEIIGEAVNRLTTEFPGIVITDSRRIIAMRNRIIHGYSGVDSVLVYQTAVGSVPALKNEILGIRAECEQAPE